jgi:hypothetical protein
MCLGRRAYAAAKNVPRLRERWPGVLEVFCGNCVVSGLRAHAGTIHSPSIVYHLRSLISWVYYYGRVSRER